MRRYNNFFIHFVAKDICAWKKQKFARGTCVTQKEVTNVAIVTDFYRRNGFWEWELLYVWLVSWCDPKNAQINYNHFLWNVAEKSKLWALACVADGKKEGLREVKREFRAPLSLLSPPKAVDARSSRLRGPMSRNRGEKFMCPPSELLRTRTSRH